MAGHKHTGRLFGQKVGVLDTGQSPTFTLNQPRGGASSESGTMVAVKLRRARWLVGDSCWSTSAVITTFKFASGLTAFSGRFIKSTPAVMTSLRIRSCPRPTNPPRTFSMVVSRSLSCTFALYFLVAFISAVVGLLTGHLFLLGSEQFDCSWNPGAHGIRVDLAVRAFLVWRIRRNPVVGRRIQNRER